MTDIVIHTRASRAAVREAVLAIPQGVIAGPSAPATLTRCGLALLGRIKQAFIVKSRGGTDEAGDRWAPLSPKTIAYSRRGRTRTEMGQDSRPSQALSKKQQERWWMLYRQGLVIFNGDKGDAARRAWGTLRREGAPTLFDKYSGRRVEILRDTGLLLNSLSPNVTSPEQVLRVERAEVVVGTRRKGAAAHHEGVPGKLPQRRLWPEPRRWPVSWWRDITDEIVQAVVDVTVDQTRDAK